MTKDKPSEEIKLERKPDVKVQGDVVVMCTVKRVGGLLMFLPLVGQDNAETFKTPVETVAVMLVEKFTGGYGGYGEHGDVDDPPGKLKLVMKKFVAIKEEVTDEGNVPV